MAALDPRRGLAWKRHIPVCPFRRSALPPPAPLPVREAWLVVHRDLKDVPRVRALVDHLVAVFEAERARLE